MRVTAFLLSLMIGLRFCSPAGAQLAEALGVAEEPIEVEADSVTYDQETNSIVAQGNVRIRHGESELQAEEVRLNRETNLATAMGRVRLTDPEGVAFAERMEVDFDDETGALLQAELHAGHLRYSLWGERIEKGSGQTYRIENGRFTTCDCESGPPSWSIAADELDVKLDGYGVAEGARFRILDVPVAYLPWVLFPVNRDRQSGLLFPRFGFSDRRGFQLVQPLYWAISKSQDATIGLDVETSARIGVLGEYRYALSPTFGGKINASYFNEAIRGRATESEKGPVKNPSVPEDRWGLVTEHTQKLGSAEAYADLLLVGDDLFLREINTLTFKHSEDVAFRTSPFTESRVGIVQRWNRLMLQGEAVVYQDLVQKQSLVLQQLPELRLAGQKILGAGFLGYVTATGTNFQRETGIAGLRGDVQPGVQLRLPLGRSVFGSLRADFHETAYQLTEDEMKGGFRGDGSSDDEVRLPASRTREIVEVGGELSTGLSRTFAFEHFGVQKLKHTIEPRAEYLFVPNVSQDDVMIFDGLDRLDERSLFTYGVVSRLLARGEGEDRSREVYELTRIAVSQSYDTNRSIPDSTTGGSADHFSDITFDMRVKPSRRTQLRFVSTFDTTSADLSSVTVGGRLLSPYGLDVRKDTGARRLLNRTKLGVAYRFVTDDPLKKSLRSLDLDETVVRRAVGIEQVDANLELRLTERLGLLYAGRYNIRDDQFLENHFGLRLLSGCDCWGVEVGVTDKSNPNEIELRLQVTLVGLGSAGL